MFKTFLLLSIILSPLFAENSFLLEKEKLYSKVEAISNCIKNSKSQEGLELCKYGISQLSPQKSTPLTEINSKPKKLNIRKSKMTISQINKIKYKNLKY